MLRKVTGSEGANPVQDGSARGLIAGAGTALLAFANNKSDLLTAPSSASAVMAARAMLAQCTSKNLRSAARVSLRPKPSVPIVT